MTFLDLLLLIGGTFFMVETVKALVPWPISSWSKQFLAAVMATGGAVLLDLPVRFGVVAVLGVAGLAALLHRSHRYFGAAGDAHQVEVLARNGTLKRRFQ